MTDPGPAAAPTEASTTAAAKTLNALLHMPAQMELSQIELIYRAEGNANLVLALPQFKKVLRLPKMISSRGRASRQPTRTPQPPPQSQSEESQDNCQPAATAGGTARPEEQPNVSDPAKGYCDICMLQIQTLYRMNIYIVVYLCVSLDCVVIVAAVTFRPEMVACNFKHPKATTTTKTMTAPTLLPPAESKSKVSCSGAGQFVYCAMLIARLAGFYSCFVLGKHTETHTHTYMHM